MPRQLEYREWDRRYVIESIVDKRRVLQRKGKDVVRGIEYYVKWKDLPASENTWEPEKEIKNRAIITRFERERERLRAENEAQAEDAPERQPVGMIEVATSSYKGFTRGLEAKRIVGATFVYGELHFLMEWNDCNELDLVPASIVNQKVPDMVIDFYEGKMIWLPLTASSIAREEEAKLRRALIDQNLEALRISDENQSSSAS